MFFQRKKINDDEDENEDVCDDVDDDVGEDVGEDEDRLFPPTLPRFTVTLLHCYTVTLRFPILLHKE